MELLSILNVDPVDSIFTTKFKLRLTWTDSRLTYINMKENEKNNILTSQHKHSIWIPKLLFANTKENSMPDYGDETSFGHVKISNYQKS